MVEHHGAVTIGRRSWVWRLLLGAVLLGGPAVHFRGDIRKKWDIVHKAVERTAPYDLAVCRCRPDRNVTLTGADGLHTGASLFGLDGDRLKPGIVLVHGNTPKGRKLPVYRLLATKLAEEGYVVLTFDCAGFGESDSPFEKGTIEALKCAPDARAAIDYLSQLPQVDSANLAIVGHSAGATVAIDAGLVDPRLDAMVAMSAPRLSVEELEDPKTRRFFRNFFLRRVWEVYHRDPPPWLTYDVWLTYHERDDLRYRMPFLLKPGHKPVFFMDGQLESPRELAWLRERYDSIPPPKGYFIVPNAHHFLNTTDLGFNGTVLYDRRVIAASVGAIDDWLDAIFGNNGFTPVAR